MEKVKPSFSTIIVENWKRKEHFHFFNSMNDPFTGIVANVDCTQAYQQAKERNTSFFLYYLHKSLEVVNQLEAFRYRIENEQVICYDSIHAATTIDNNEGTFSFAFLDFHDSYTEFEQNARAKIEGIKLRGGLGFDDDQQRKDCIHYTSMPWVSFTALKHATNTEIKGSCPKISFGKYFENNGKLLLPVSVEVNHALMDGKEIGQYYEYFQQLLNE